VHKPSFNLVLEHMDAMVELAGHDHVIEGERLAFRLKRMEQISPVMLEWVRERLGTKGPGNRDQGIENRE
jgi:microsomal dipeptidase-like Zn-dependent dipeptidase